MSNHFFADLHSHITLFPYNMASENTEGMLYSKDPENRHDNPINYTQSDITKMAIGGLRIVFASLYALEKGFVKIFDNEGWIADEVIHKITGFPIERINKVQADDHSYFDDLKNEYELLLQYNDTDLKIKNDTRTCRYKIVENYSQLKDFLEFDNPNRNENTQIKIAVILTVEGGHSLFPVSTENINQDYVNNTQSPNLLFEEIKNNIDWLREKKVFSITFAHHFYNYLCGQSISFTLDKNIFLDQGAMSTEGFTPLGEMVILELLNTTKRPIIIDVKHLSVPSRIWFYNLEFAKNVPVIASHAAVNGARKMKGSMIMNANHLEAQAKYLLSTNYNNWDLNLSDEEIVIIAQRRGLIGISLDQRIIMGLKRINDTKDNEMQLDDAKNWSFCVFDTIMYIAKVLKSNGFSDSEIWSVQTIGSDFDGMINPLDAYQTVMDYPKLQENLIYWFNDKNALKPYRKCIPVEGLDIDEIVKNVMYSNCLRFLEQNFM